MTVFPDGTKERLHGHNYQMKIVIDLAEVATATFLDLNVGKGAMERICRRWNEHLLLPERAPELEIVSRDQDSLEFRLCGKRYVVPADEVVFLPIDNISVEGLAMHVAELIVADVREELRRGKVVGIEVEIAELPGQGARYYLPFTG